MKKFAKRALCTFLACTTIAGAGVGLAACDNSGDETVQLVIGVQQTTKTAKSTARIMRVI